MGRENIYAGYAQLKYTFDKSWSASASLRSEHTYYFLDFKTWNENISDSYTDFFPYFTTSYNSADRNYQSSLSFGSSIERPDYVHLLPGIRYQNQYRYIKGNPGFNNFVYTMHTKWMANAGIFYNAPKDNWSLSLDINDLFHSNKTFRERPFDGNISREYSYMNSRFITLSFVMKFKGGEKVEDKAKYDSVEMDRFSTK